MMLQNIESFQKLCLRFQHECSIICGVASIGVIYIFSFNRNILYLSFLWAIYTISSALFTHFKTVLVGLAILVFLAIYPINIPKGEFIKPTQNRVDFKDYYYTRPKPSKVWQYTFQVKNIEKHQRECGGKLQGNLIIEGIDLLGLEIVIEGNIFSNADKYIQQKYQLEQIQIPLEKNSSREIVVSLHPKTGASPLINLGAESHEFDIYSDAVWLEFKNNQCSVLYHAQRHVIPWQ